MLLRDTPEIIVKPNNEQFILMMRNGQQKYGSVSLQASFAPQRQLNDEMISV